MPSLLAINIGNTNISIGLFKDDTLINCLRISTKKGAHKGIVKSGLSPIYGDCPRNNPPDGIILASVVPTITGEFK
ncbi:MAG: type III pantothenate kinase, partial [Candidatus Omnitrophica bacterium]|nr:type III pantothenate kinase [Candidatus Omnitrophota bacterium]